MKADALVLVRCCSNSGQTRVRSICPLSANSGHRCLSKNFGGIRIHPTHVPVEEPSTASIADISNLKLNRKLAWQPACQCIGQRLNTGNQRRNFRFRHVKCLVAERQLRFRLTFGGARCDSTIVVMHH